MKHRIKSFTISNLYCEECHKAFPIPRPSNKIKPKGHIKTFYCPYCKKTTDHREERYCDHKF